MDVQKLIPDKNRRKWNVSEFCSGFSALILCGEKRKYTRECVRTVFAHVMKCLREIKKESAMDE